MITKSKLCIIFLLIIISFSSVYGQQKRIDSLKNLLKRQAKTDTNTVNILNDLAFIYNWSEQTKADFYTKKALATAIKLNYRSGEARAYVNLGYQCINNNADPRALEYLNKSYNIYKSLNDKLKLSNVLTIIGLYYGTINDYNTNLDYDLQALEAIKGLNTSLPELRDLTNIGDDYEKINKYEKAEDYYVKAYNLVKKIGNPEFFPIAYMNLESINLQQKKYQVALFYCNKIKQLQINISEPEKAEADLIEAQIYYGLKNYVNAKKSLNISDIIAHKNQLMSVRLEVYHVRYLLDSAMHNPDSALKYAYLYHQLNDNITNDNKSQVSAAYSFKVKAQKNADENLRLHIIREKNKAIINKRHTIWIILLLGLFILLCGFIYLKRSYNQIKIKNTIIKVQNQNLENSNMVKDKLFSVISHDLRSPVAQVVGLINLWETGDMDNKEMLTITPVIKKSITNTLELLDTLLIWATNQLQGFKFNAFKFKIYDLVKQNINDLDAQIKKKQLAVYNGISYEAELYADYEMLKIVFRNLISNAIKFTHNGGAINVNSYTENGQIVVVVEDTGIGISEVDMDKVFSFRSHCTLGTANEKGAGIGLKICREFIELNNGNIWIESKEGAGSRFFVSFPVDNHMIIEEVI